MLVAPMTVNGTKVTDVPRIELDRYVVDACRALLWLVPHAELRRSMLSMTPWREEPMEIDVPVGGE
jgi:hypothetical protein